MPELAAWDSFYVIVGSAAGALIGLQFVVVTLIAQRPTRATPDASAAFGTPTIVHFGAYFTVSGAVARPLANDRRPGRAVGSHRLLWDYLRRDRVAAHAQARRIRTGIRGLVISRRTADDGLCRTDGVGLRDCFAQPRSSVRRRRRGIAVAFHRHP